MTIIINESFEGAGYDEVWATSTDTGCTLNADAVTPGNALKGLGAQSLKADVLNVANNDAFIYQSKSAQTKTYIRQFVYVNSHTLLDTESVFIGGGFTAGFAMVAAGTYLINQSGALKLGGVYYSNGINQYPTAAPIVTGRWYEIEIYYNTVKNEWEWWLDRKSQGKESLTGVTGNPEIFFSGLLGSTSGSPISVYSDLITVDDNNRIQHVISFDKFTKPVVKSVFE